MTIEVIGWTSSALLLLTLSRQVYTQWKARSTAGISKWLFIGQVAASVGYSIYSFLLDNWVLFASNIAILCTAVLGEILFLRNKALKFPSVVHQRRDVSQLSSVFFIHLVFNISGL